MKYEKLFLEICNFTTEDIVTASTVTGNPPLDDDGEYPEGWD